MRNTFLPRGLVGRRLQTLTAAGKQLRHGQTAWRKKMQQRRPAAADLLDMLSHKDEHPVGGVVRCTPRLPKRPCCHLAHRGQLAGGPAQPQSAERLLREAATGHGCHTNALAQLRAQPLPLTAMLLHTGDRPVYRVKILQSKYLWLKQMPC